MKKLFLIAAICCITSINCNAQEVYKEILRLSQQGAADKSKDLDTRRVYQFKVDELTYMLMKFREQMPDSSMLVVDRQAYAMYDFVNAYIADLANASKKKDKQLVREVYKNATIHNPYFNDMDKDLVLSYYRRDDFLCQFSLDTNWIKAKAEAAKVMASAF